MKVCPACRTTFDDSQNFCLNDGTPLVPAETDPETETVVVERETPVKPKNYSPTGRQNASPTSAAKTPQTGFIVGATALATLLLIGLGAGAYFWMSDGADNGNANANTNSISNLNSNSAPRSSPPVTTANSSLGSAGAAESPQVSNPNSELLAPRSETEITTNPPTAAPTPPPVRLPQKETATIRKQVTGTLSSWADAIENNDLNGHLGFYADTLEYYYTTRGYSKNQVRADKQRAFQAFDDVEFNTSNVRVMPESADRVIVIYDKEWNFSNDDGRMNEGKVQSQVTLHRINGRWLIVGERDLKVYYQRSQ